MGESIEGIAIFITDEEPIGSRILYVNEAFCAMSGFRIDQLVGHSALLLAGSRPDPVMFTTALGSPKFRPYEARERKTRPDGSTYLADIRLEVLGEDRLVLTQRLVPSASEAPAAVRPRRMPKRTRPASPAGRG